MTTNSSPRKTVPCPPETRRHLGRTWQRVITPLGTEPSMTKQEFKNETDINQILKRYQRTGALTHYSKYAPQYGDFTSTDLQQAQNLLITARQMFAELPSSIRSLTQTPEGFLDFVQDPANAAKMAELGLIESPTPVIPPPPSTPAA